MEVWDISIMKDDKMTYTRFFLTKVLFLIDEKSNVSMRLFCKRRWFSSCRMEYNTKNGS